MIPAVVSDTVQQQKEQPAEYSLQHRAVQHILPDAAWQPAWHAEPPCQTERVLLAACLWPGRHALHRSTGLLCSQGPAKHTACYELATSQGCHACMQHKA